MREITWPQQIGGAVGIAAIVTIYTAYLKPEIFHSGLRNAFSVAAVVCVAASVIVFLTVKINVHATSNQTKRELDCGISTQIKTR